MSSDSFYVLILSFFFFLIIYLSDFITIRRGISTHIEHGYVTLVKSHTESQFLYIK